MRRLLPLIFALVLFASCDNTDHCRTPIGITNFQIEPFSASYPGLNSVGGYEYLTGGHCGVIIVRTGLEDFVAYERTCPLDTTTAVQVSAEYGSSVLECPVCHSFFSVYSNGTPMTNSQTPCSLFEYGTTFNGRTLWVY